MFLSKSAFLGAIFAATAMVLSACSAHHAHHPSYRVVKPAPHHRTTVVHPRPRHRTVIVNPRPRHRTVIVNPPPRHRTVIVNPPPRHRTVIVNPPAHGRDRYRGRRPHRGHDTAVNKGRRGAEMRHQRARNRQRYEPARPQTPYRSSRVGSTRNPKEVMRSGAPQGYLGGGRPGRPDVVMPKARRGGMPSSHSPAKARQSAAKQPPRQNRNASPKKPRKSNRSNGKDMKDEALNGRNRR